MRAKQWIQILLTLSALAGGGSGCAHRGAAPANAVAADSFPFALEGDDTHIRIDFTSAAADSAVPHELIAGEICCLAVGSSTVECFADGSLLRFGPRDGLTLVDDNPLWKIHSGKRGGDSQRLLKLYALLFLVGGSVEKLPQTLADYLEDDGPHRADVIDLVRRLVIDGGADLPARGRGGTFLLRVWLTDAGREKLVDALQSIQEETGLQYVRLPGVRSTSEFTLQ